MILPGGALESIATVTVGSGGASSIQFTSIPGTYQHLQLRWIARGTGTGNYPASSIPVFNGDTTQANYYQHALEGNGSGAYSGAWSGNWAGMFRIGGTAMTSNCFAAGVTDILDYASSTKTKVMRTFEGGEQNTTPSRVWVCSTLWNSQSAITTFSITADSTYMVKFAQHSTFALYGVKAP